MRSHNFCIQRRASSPSRKGPSSLKGLNGLQSEGSWISDTPAFPERGALSPACSQQLRLRYVIHAQRAQGRKRSVHREGRSSAAEDAGCPDGKAKMPSSAKAIIQMGTSSYCSETRSS